MKDAKVTLKNAQLVFCHECMGHYSDGERDCENNRCPLYPFHKYAKSEPDFSWTRYNPTRTGKVLFEDCETREQSDSSRRALEEYRANKCTE